ncbi:hypothetical protein TNCV_2551161 [Trichonephila clavipes]|nr:hypothetical protein TNCV_2551161 [Trichonephila clavipes]
MLKRVIVTEWNIISSEETSKLVQSMPKRLTEVLRLTKSGISRQICKWDLKLVASCGMGSENEKSLILMILIGTMGQNY